MMTTSYSDIHSEVVGSLLRPTHLVEARKRFETGQIGAAEFKSIEDQASAYEV